MEDHITAMEQLIHALSKATIAAEASSGSSPWAVLAEAGDNWLAANDPPDVNAVTAPESRIDDIYEQLSADAPDDVEDTTEQAA
jgi:hypothetical protein